MCLLEDMEYCKCLTIDNIDIRNRDWKQLTWAIHTCGTIRVASKTTKMPKIAQKITKNHAFFKHFCVTLCYRGLDVIIKLHFKYHAGRQIITGCDDTVKGENLDLTFVQTVLRGWRKMTKAWNGCGWDIWRWCCSARTGNEVSSCVADLDL